MNVLTRSISGDLKFFLVINLKRNGYLLMQRYVLLFNNSLHTVKTAILALDCDECVKWNCDCIASQMPTNVKHSSQTNASYIINERKLFFNMLYIHCRFPLKP